MVRTLDINTVAKVQVVCTLSTSWSCVFVDLSLTPCPRLSLVGLLQDGAFNFVLFNL